MLIEKGKDWYKIGLKIDYPWLLNDVAVFKRVGPFNWEPVDVTFDSVEDAQEYLKFIGMPGVVA